jgi:hypothetical protein
MRLTKRQLKRIIREEYSRLKRRGLIREGRIGYDEGEGNMPRGATDLMDIAKDAFSYGDGDGIIMHWMQTLGVAANETGEVDEEDFMAIQRYESQFNPNAYDEGLMRQLMMNLSQDAVDLLYGG